MAVTLLLDSGWDITTDDAGNIALAQEPLALAQDAASAIQTWLGEWYLDTTVGVPWLSQILGRRPSLALLKQRLVDAALSVPGVVSAQVFITAFSDRGVAGQVQVIGAGSNQIGAMNFAVANVQGSG